MARPTKLTPEVEEKFLNAVRTGNYLEVAAAYAGIAKPTLFAWMRRGRSSSRGLYHDFVEKLDKANAAAEAVAVSNLMRHGRDDYRAITFFLERRFNDRWGQKSQMKVEVERELEAAIEKLSRGLPPEEFKRVVTILANRDDREEPPQLPAAAVVDS